MTTVQDIYEFIDSFAPFCTAASWDNSGLLLGDKNTAVTKCVVALDVTGSEIELAKQREAQLILSHHPLIFHPVKSMKKGDAVYEAARSGVSVLCAHTNLDKAPGGVNDALCEALEMDFEKLPENVGDGFLNAGFLPVKGSAEETASYISAKLGGAVRFTSCLKAPTRFAVCSGAGGDLAPDAKAAACDALITGDASYHDFLDAESLGVTLFAAGHFETESIIVPKLIKMLSVAFSDVEFIPSERIDPVITVK